MDSTRIFDYRRLSNYFFITLFMSAPAVCFLVLVMNPRFDLPPAGIAGCIALSIAMFLYAVFWSFRSSNERIIVHGDIIRWTELNGNVTHEIRLSEPGLIYIPIACWQKGARRFEVSGATDRIRFFSFINDFAELDEIIVSGMRAYGNADVQNQKPW
jgi:hypothetical protein